MIWKQMEYPRIGLISHTKLFLSGKELLLDDLTQFW
jgi:hypothetical protein